MSETEFNKTEVIYYTNDAAEEERDQLLSHVVDDVLS
jgi:hypothetical protein